MEPTRLNPGLPAHAYKTYQIVSPLSTHYRPATCQEVDCPAMINGWRTVVDESTPLGAKQAHYIRKVSRRTYREDKDLGVSALTVFVFGPGQLCFAQHQLRNERPEVYLVRDGDHRGNPRGTTPRRHTRAEDWVEDFTEHQGRLAEQIEKG